ncbi:hypothetical protein [Chromobacterium sphagni]|nr:hypothetical protein [Chromobacterium sphagni]
MPLPKPPLLPSLLLMLGLLAGCNAGSAPSATEASAGPPRKTGADNRHFWRKREIEEVSRRIIEKELGYQDPLRLAADDDSLDERRYRFRLMGVQRKPLGLASEDIAFTVQADLANGRIISIHCHPRSADSQACHPHRRRIWS